MISAANTIPSECPVCFNNSSYSQFVYSACCFKKVCAVCDRILSQCPQCRAELGKLRITFGNSCHMKEFPQLRLLPEHKTIGDVISTVRNFFPSIEIQLSHWTYIVELYTRPDGSYKWGLPSIHQTELIKEQTYCLERVRLPDLPLTNQEVECWIVNLIHSGNRFIARATKEEIHKKCNHYAQKYCPFNLSMEYTRSD